MGSHEIVLTADRSFMSNYHYLPFLRGLRFASTNILPSSLFFRFVSPSVPMVNNGIALLAPYHTRRTEATLLDFGFDRSQVIVVAPDKIHNFISSDTKILSITVRDPLSRIHHYSLLNPLGGKSYSSLSFKELCENLQTRNRGYKVVVEGPGAWQLVSLRDRRRFPIDHVIVGEYTTSTVPSIFKNIIDGKEVPEVIYASNTELEKTPLIRGGVTEGLVEVASGCNRGCRFCNVPRVKCRPVKEVVAEVKTNVRYGQRNITLRSDDIFNYGAKGLKIDREGVTRLYLSVREVQGVKRIGQCYLNLASAVSNPGLVEEVTEIIGAGSKEYPYATVLTGIETGSPELIEKYMPGKAWPFNPSEWPSIVEQGFGILDDNHWVPTGMLILGLPGEREEDIYETIALIERLKPYESVFVPFLFRAKSVLSQGETFQIKDLKKHHLELVEAMFNHNIRWGKLLITRQMSNRLPMRGLLPLASSIINWGVEAAYRRLFDEIVASYAAA